MMFLLFDDIIGNDSIKAAISNHNLPHAILLTGGEGTGKMMLASAIASFLICRNPDGINPCGVCTTCKMMKADTMPDIYTVSSKNDKDIKVGDIRELTDKISVKPAYSQHFIAIIEDGHKMNEEAQNALLKSLEEPPEGCVFIITCRDKTMLLPTILSRVTEFQVKPLNREQISQFLINKYPDKINKMDFIFEYSQGALGIAEKLCADDDFAEQRQKTIDILSNVIEGKHDSCFALAEYLDSDKTESDRSVEIMTSVFGDILRMKISGNDAPFTNDDIKGRLKIFESKLTLTDTQDAIAALADFKRMTKHNVNVRAAGEITAMRLRGQKK